MPRRPLPDPIGDDADATVELANRLNSAAIHLLRRIAQEDGADGVTGARLSALSVVVYGGHQSLGSVARRERVSTPTMAISRRVRSRGRLTSITTHTRILFSRPFQERKPASLRFRRTAKPRQMFGIAFTLRSRIRVD
jgi:hypothetical protein